MGKNPLATKISNAGFKTFMRRDCARRAMICKNPSFSNELGLYDEVMRNSALDDAAHKVTVGDLIPALEIEMREFEARRYSWFVLNGTLANELKRIGLTQLDFIGLACCPVDIERLKKLGKSKLLQLSARILGTLSSVALRRIANEKEKLDSEITIADLLATRTDSDDSQLFVRTEQSVLLTREKLLALGFKFREGIFLRCGTRSQFIADLMASEKIGRKMAERITALAERQRWVKHPIND